MEEQYIKMHVFLQHKQRPSGSVIRTPFCAAVIYLYSASSRVVLERTVLSYIGGHKIEVHKIDARNYDLKPQLKRNALVYIKTYIIESKYVQLVPCKKIKEANMRLRLRNYNMHQCIIIFAKGLLIISIIL